MDAVIKCEPVEQINGEQYREMKKNMTEFNWMSVEPKTEHNNCKLNEHYIEQDKETITYYDDSTTEQNNTENYGVKPKEGMNVFEIKIEQNAGEKYECEQNEGRITCSSQLTPHFEQNNGKQNEHMLETMTLIMDVEPTNDQKNNRDKYRVIPKKENLINVVELKTEESTGENYEYEQKEGLIKCSSHFRPHFNEEQNEHKQDIMTHTADVEPATIQNSVEKCGAVPKEAYIMNVFEIKTEPNIEEEYKKEQMEEKIICSSQFRPHFEQNINEQNEHMQETMTHITVVEPTPEQNNKEMYGVIPKEENIMNAFEIKTKQNVEEQNELREEKMICSSQTRPHFEQNNSVQNVNMPETMSFTTDVEKTKVKVVIDDVYSLNVDIEVDSDDSLNDPDFWESDLSDLSDICDTYDDNQHFGKRKRKSPNNCCDDKRAKIDSNEKESVSNSDSEEESLTVPVLSKFRGTKSKPCTTKVSEEKRISLLPKKGKQDGCKQVYDKVNFCTYCKKGISSKISRHLLNVHKEESRVSNIVLMPKMSPARKVKLEILANEGNFKHNLDVLKNKKGFLVVARRENNVGEYKTGNYLPCRMCKKFISKTSLWTHQKNCSIRKFENLSNNYNTSNSVRLSQHLLKSALLEEVDIVVSKLLTRMNNDEITLEVKQDSLIRRYAAVKVESLGREQVQNVHNINLISQSCRIMARVVIKCREKSKHIIDMDRLIHTRNFDLLVDATKLMCFNKPAPSLGKLIGKLLLYFIQVKKGAALKECDEKRLHEANNFENLFVLEWSSRVNAVCQKMTNTIYQQNSKPFH